MLISFRTSHRNCAAIVIVFVLWLSHNVSIYVSVHTHTRPASQPTRSHCNQVFCVYSKIRTDCSSFTGIQFTKGDTNTLNIILEKAKKTQQKKTDPILTNSHTRAFICSSLRVEKRLYIVVVVVWAPRNEFVGFLSHVANNSLNIIVFLIHFACVFLCVTISKLGRIGSTFVDFVFLCKKCSLFGSVNLIHFILWGKTHTHEQMTNWFIWRSHAFLFR